MSCCCCCFWWKFRYVCTLCLNTISLNFIDYVQLVLLFDSSYFGQRYSNIHVCLIFSEKNFKKNHNLITYCSLIFDMMCLLWNCVDVPWPDVWSMLLMFDLMFWAMFPTMRGVLNSLCVDFEFTDLYPNVSSVTVFYSPINMLLNFP